MVTAFAFECGDSTVYRVRFGEADVMQLIDGESSYELTRVRSASGAQYRGDDIEFWNKGGEATITVGDASRVCQRQ